MKATSKFSPSQWDEKTYQKISDEMKMTKVSTIFDLKGEITGKAAVEYVMVYTHQEADPHKGAATYTGLMRIEGTVNGKTGSFVLEDRGIFQNGAANSTLAVVAGSGTGELSGITGNADYLSTPENCVFNLSYNL